jgi:hypothetical protein
MPALRRTVEPNWCAARWSRSNPSKPWRSWRWDPSFQGLLCSWTCAGRLHKAGVPDLPYELDKLGTRLNGPETAALLFGSENEGRDLIWGDQLSGKILKDGTFYAHVGDWRETGRSWIESDALCLDFPTQFRRCAAILKNPQGTFEHRNEYLFVHQGAKLEFSITRRIE